MMSRGRSSPPRALAVLVVVGGLCFAAEAFARGGHGGGHPGACTHFGSSGGGHHGSSVHGGWSPTRPVLSRDEERRIERYDRAIHDFRQSNPCPSTGLAAGSCPGYAIDHIKPLREGGKEDPSNLKWRTVEAASG